MKDKYFIDTNIFIYSFDNSNIIKKEFAEELIIAGLVTGNACISFQVIQEFINVSTKKFEIPFSTADCLKYTIKILEPLCEVFPSFELYKKAIEIMERWKYSFYDSLIISAALLDANCKILYSEDLQHGQKIYSLTILNPFSK